MTDTRFGHPCEICGKVASKDIPTEDTPPVYEVDLRVTLDDEWFNFTEDGYESKSSRSTSSTTLIVCYDCWYAVISYISDKLTTLSENNEPTALKNYIMEKSRKDE